MRFVELVLRIPGDEFKIRFHDQLTVLSGIGMLERQALAESLIGAVTGSAESTVLTLLDAALRPAQIVSSNGRATGIYLDDRTAVPPILGTLALDAETLRSLMLVKAPDIGPNITRARREDPPELAEARATLATLTTELQEALSGRQQLDGVRAELAEIEAKLVASEDGKARREYARVLTDLERVRAEAAALQSGAAGIETDRHLLAGVDDARELAARWSEAADRVAQLIAAFGDRTRLDEDDVTRLRSIPEHAPSTMPGLIGQWEAATRDRDQREARLHELAAARLPEPSDPCVVDLARIDQGELWATHGRVLDVRHRLELEQLKLGGLGMDLDNASVVEDLEAAHAHVEAAEATLRRRWLPTLAASGALASFSLAAASHGPVAALPALAASLCIVAVGLGGPNRHLIAARREEQDALAGTGAPTYLSFHMRRVDAAIDPTARRRLDATTIELQAAIKTWNETSGGVDVDAAGALKDEVRQYVAALAGMGGAADEIEELHQDLRDRAGPAVAAARAALVDLLIGLGLDRAAAGAGVDGHDAAAFEVVVAQQLTHGRVARMQAELDDAASDEEKLRAHLDDLLNQLGFDEGNIEARTGALERAVRNAAEREEARARARPPEEIEGDLNRLQAEAARMRRPEWASLMPSDAVEPDADELRSRREALRARLAATPATATDIERLADRHGAMELRVASLESKFGNGHSEAVVAQLADVQQYLLAHLTQAAHVGPQDESVPVVLDEPLLRVAAERKWELLDMLRRFGEKTQLIYLTDDPFVTAWSRRRAAAGVITLLEPDTEPV